MPSLAWCAIALGAGTAVASALHVRACTIVAAGGLIAIIVLSLKRRRLAALVMAALLSGLCAGALFWADFDHRAKLAARSTYGRHEVLVASDPLPGRFGASAFARVGSGPLEGARVRLCFPKGSSAELGQRLEVFGRLKPAGTDERGRSQRRAGILGSLSARRIRVIGWGPPPLSWTYRLRRAGARAVGEVEGSGGDLLAGVLLGDRRRLEGTEAEAAFESCGLTHLVAVSGGHLVVTAGLAAMVLSTAGAGRWLRYLGTTLVAAGYVVFTGTQPSAVRAAMMAAIAGAVIFGHRRADALGALAAGATVMMLLWPATVFDLGFQLSCSAVAALVVFGRLAGGWMRAALPVGVISDAIALTLVAQAATVPLTAPVFGSVSLIAPVANAVAAPLVELGLAVGLAGLAALPVPVVSRSLLGFASLPLSLACWVAQRLADLPAASIPASRGVIAATWALPAVAVWVWAAWPQAKPRRAAVAFSALVAACLLAAAVPIGRASSGVVALDVGQGDAILVCDGAHTVLVDCGPSPSALRKALARNGVRRLDAVVITHLHDDHFGGLEGVRGVIPVETLLGPAGSAERLRGLANACGDARTAELMAGDRVRAGEITLDVIWPTASVPDPATNEASVVTVARAGAASALLTGDAEADVLDVLAARSALPDVDVLKIGHHGSVGVVDDISLDALRPERAVISVGTNNRFGHPRPQTLAALLARGISVDRTDESGDVRVLPP